TDPFDRDTFVVDFALNAGNPLEPIAWPISASIRVFVREGASGEINYSIHGSHDGFPAYEMYINGTEVYTHEADGTWGPLDLCGAMSQIIDLDWQSLGTPPSPTPRSLVSSADRSSATLPDQAQRTGDHYFA